jgi:hypothetical protein
MTTATEDRSRMALRRIRRRWRDQAQFLWDHGEKVALIFFGSGMIVMAYMLANLLVG